MSYVTRPGDPASATGWCVAVGETKRFFIAGCFVLLIVPIDIANVRSRFNWASKDEMGREKAPYSTVWGCIGGNDARPPSPMATNLTHPPLA